MNNAFKTARLSFDVSINENDKTITGRSMNTVNDELFEVQYIFDDLKIIYQAVETRPYGLSKVRDKFYRKQ